MIAAEGILTAKGGVSSHAALVARQMGKVCICGASAVEINYDTKTVTVAGKKFKEGDYMSIDGTAGTGSGSVAIPGTLVRKITVPFNDPTNPFVHQYHPDHDNKDPKGNALIAGQESYNIEREVTFTFTASPPPGSTVTSGWGSAVIGGTYGEVVQGLHKDSAGVGTGDGLHLTGTFELRRASEFGSISVTP